MDLPRRDPRLEWTEVVLFVSRLAPVNPVLM
jgi:hypothetical protein